MKLQQLKLVVASMSMLGFVAFPMAASAGKAHHHKMRHQMVTHHDYKDYKDMVPAGPVVCTISQNTMIMNDMTQNMGRAMPNQCNPGWFDRISLSGGVNVDFGKFGNRNANLMGVNYQVFSLNDAYLNIGAKVTDWAKAFASISYNTATVTAPTIVDVGNPNVAEYSAAYSNNVTAGGNNTLQLEQAYATFGNFDYSPVFVQVGKQFQDFSRYEIHPITRSLTQVLSETLATSGKVGFIFNGFNGSAYVFDDPLSKVGKTTNTTNGGLALGYDHPGDALGFDLGAAYLYNLVGVNDVAYNVNQFTGGGYNSRVSATALYADVNSGPFVLSGRYTTALQRFNQNDLPSNGMADVVGLATVATTATGAKPWAAGIQAAYGFEGWGHNQNVYVGYQASRQAAGLNMPRSRWQVGYGMNAFGNNTNVAIEWDNDRKYSTSTGGNGNTYNLVTLRTGVKFG